MQKKKIAVVDDDQNMSQLVRDVLELEGYTVQTYSSAGEALIKFKRDLPDLLITDLKMKEIDGLMLLKKMQEDHPSVVTVMMTAFGSVDTAIDAMKAGAFHYIIKPFKNAELVLLVKKAFDQIGLKRDVAVLRKEIRKEFSLESIIGKSLPMQQLFSLIKRISTATANLLIQGESGSGKELVARAIHASGPRSRGPFVPINCSAIPEQLLESELFGHVKGSFTGAVHDHAGLFVEANNGTLFLDEIGDLSLQLQAKLLRVIQDRQVRPVGSSEHKKVDVRVITATHKDLQTMVREEKFREDLFYRLNVIPVRVPPLRERKEDIPLLVHHFFEKFSAQNGSMAKSVSPEALTTLMSHPWPGNVRELENIMERAVVLTSNTAISPEDVLGLALDNARKKVDEMYSDRPTLEKLEERYIRLILGEVRNQKEEASKVLGISRRTLYRKERTYGLISADSVEPAEDVSSEQTMN